MRNALGTVVPIVAPGIVAGGLPGFIGAVGEYTSSALMYTVASVPTSVAMTNAMFCHANPATSRCPYH